MSTRDAPAMVTGSRGLQGMRIDSTAPLGAGMSGARTVTSEVEVITYGYQIPDFNPDDLYTHHYHFGMFSETGNGNGTAYPDTDGYVEYEINRHGQENEMQTFVYSVNAETGEARVFIDVNGISVNKAVSILTNVAMNARMNAQRSRQVGSGMLPRGAFRIPSEIGNQLRMDLHGDYLTLDDIQEEIFRQTRCNVEEEDGRYYLESCR